MHPNSRTGFARVANRVLTQRGALIFDFLFIFTDDLKVLCWRGDFLSLRIFFLGNSSCFSAFSLSGGTEFVKRLRFYNVLGFKMPLKRR